MCRAGYAQYNPFETEFSDTVYNVKNQPISIKFYNNSKEEVGVSKFEYHINDTVKTLIFTGIAGEISSSYNEYGHLLKSTTQRGTFISSYFYEYEYDETGQLIRVRGYNTGGLLFISNRYTYEDGLQTKIERFNTSDQLFDWTEYKYDSMKNFISSITYNSDTLIIKTRKKFKLTPDSDKKEYLIKYTYEDGLLATLEVYPSDVTFGEMRVTRKTVIFHCKENKLDSFTYYELEDDDSEINANNPGTLITVDESTKEHPIVKEFNYVMSRVP